MFCRKSSHCRNLSHSVAKRRDRPQDQHLGTVKKIDVPKPSRHFLISRGPSCAFGIAIERVLSRRCSAIPLQSMESFFESTVSRSLAPKWPGREHFLSGNASAIPLCGEGVFVLERTFFQAIEKYYRPASPSPFPLYATAGGTGMAERKRFLSRKVSAIAFK